MAISTLAASSITIDAGGIMITAALVITAALSLVCLGETTLYACVTLIQFYGVQCCLVPSCWGALVMTNMFTS